MRRALSHLSYANVVATMALFAAVGGGAYAAVKLPKASVGSAQLKANAVTSSKVKDRSLLAQDFGTGQLPAGPRGLKGDSGAPGAPGAAGHDGATGPRGPGTVTYDGQFAKSLTPLILPIGNGLEAKFFCFGSNDSEVAVESINTGDTFYGWGTASDGSSLQLAPLTGHQLGTSQSTSVAQLDGVAASTPAGGHVAYTRFDGSLITGTMCNYHLLVIPPS